MRKSLLVLLLALVCGCSSAESPAPPSRSRVPPRPPTLITDVQENVPVFVRAVIDARTVELDSGERVRISLLAAPADCWAAAAVAFARKTLLMGAVRVTTVIPGEVNLWLEDGTDYALLAVREGVLRAQGAAGRLAEAEALAARENRGLWGLPCNGMDAVPNRVTPTTTKRLVPPKPTTTTTPPPPPPPTTTAPPTPPCKVSYRISGQWPGGFQANVTIRNTGKAAVNGWTLRWSFGDGQTVRQMWNASSSQRGAAVSATNVHYTATIAPNGEVSIGFLGSYGRANSAPAAFTLNGAACTTG
ncbi:cellulose-binding domain-containing protein [Lentzea alba]|uniref:cellulose-binding domain-containing protein n=1 Tax=Lentzea alba TaxID=2714351 RepID=UPI0039BF4B57